MAPQKPQTEIVLWQPGQLGYRIANGEVELPPALEGKIDLLGWLNTLVHGVKYREPDPEYMARAMMIQSLTATTVEQLLDDSGLLKLQEEIDNFAGATSGPIEIVDLYITGSDLSEDEAAYMILTIVDLETRVVGRYSTGAGSLQTKIMGMIALGQWPIRGQIVRTASKDKGGRHLFQLYPID